jgi:hypothetical protein
VAAGEEISWGQRVFGLETPAALSEANVQDETNLHNLAGVEGRADTAFQLLWMGGFILVPLAAAASSWARRRLTPLFPVAGLDIALIFLGVYLGAQVAEQLLGSATWTSIYDVTHAVTETKEALAGLALGAAGVVTARREARAPAARPARSAALAA